MYRPAAPFDAASMSKPNIIIIGIDSLRPDFLIILDISKKRRI